MPEDFYIPGNVPSSKNNKQIISRRLPNGKTIPFLIDSKNTQHYRKHYGIMYKSIKSDFLEAVKDIPKPYHVGFYFVRDSHRDFDLHNAVQIVADMMSEYLIIADDNAGEFVPVFLGYCVDSKSNAGVYLRIMDEDYVTGIKEFDAYYKEKLFKNNFVAA